jgi:hypothetical protein
MILWDVESGAILLQLHAKAPLTTIDWRESRIAFGDSGGIVYFLELEAGGE